MNPISKKVFNKLKRIDLKRLNSLEIKSQLEDECELSSEVVDKAIEDLIFNEEKLAVEQRRVGQFNVQTFYRIMK